MGARENFERVLLVGRLGGCRQQVLGRILGCMKLLTAYGTVKQQVGIGRGPGERCQVVEPLRRDESGRLPSEVSDVGQRKRI